ncbi:hypothetical protein RYB01_17295 [Pseudomonas syringae]|nr:hypothetical protein [Pseudomonas syringae]
MTNKNGMVVSTPGHKPFPMILLECALDHAGALAFARSIWPRCTVDARHVDAVAYPYLVALAHIEFRRVA